LERFLFDFREIVQEDAFAEGIAADEETAVR